MANIKLPTYKTLIPNEVFWRRAKSILDSEMGEISAREITRIIRYRIPTENETINFIREKADSINTQILGWNETFEDKRTTLFFLKNLPSFEIENIAKGNRESINQLKKYFPKRDLLDGNTYLSTVNGIVPNCVLNTLEETISGNDAEMYEDVIIKTGANRWILKIRLPECGELPKTELQYLSNKGVRDSNLFVVRGEFEEYQIVANQIKLLYNTLNSSEMVGKVRDISNEILENCSSLAVSGVAQKIEEVNLIGKEINRLMDLFYGGLEEEEQEEAPKKSPRNLEFYIK